MQDDKRPEWHLFCWAVIRHWGWLVSGVIVTIAAYGWGQIRHYFQSEGPDLPIRISYIVGLGLIFIACFLAWRDEHRSKVLAEGEVARVRNERPDLRIIFDKSDPAMWWKEQHWCRIAIMNDSEMAMARNVKVRAMKMTPDLLSFKALPSRLGAKDEDNSKESSIAPKGSQLFDVFRWAPPETDDFTLWIVIGGQGFILPVGASCDLILEASADLVQPKSNMFRISRPTNGEPTFSDVTTT